jgi:hypothetical protein
MVGKTGLAPVSLRSQRNALLLSYNPRKRFSIRQKWIIQRELLQFHSTRPLTRRIDELTVFIVSA